MLSMEWLLAWWRAYGTGHRLHVVLIHANQQLVGFVPLYQHRFGLGCQLRFLGTGSACSDYLTAVVDQAQQQVVYDAIADYLWMAHRELRKPGLTGLHLEGMLPSDPWLKHLRRFASEREFSLRSQTIIGSWSIDLPTTWDEFIACQRGRNIQRKAKKLASRFQSGELQLRYVTQAEEAEAGVQTLIRLHQARRESCGDVGCFADDRFARFLREALVNMMARGTARLCICESEGSVLAIQVQLLSPSTIFMYQTGADPHQMKLEPGHSLIAGALMESIAGGYRVYDFLRGDEPYKAMWGAHATPLQRVILAPPTLKAQTIEAVHRNLSIVKHWSVENLLPVFQRPANM